MPDPDTFNEASETPAAAAPAAPPEPTAEELAAIREALGLGEEALAALPAAAQAALTDLWRRAREREEYLDLARRTQADFQNYRRRVAREKADLVFSANQELLGTLLPALDAFARAQKNAEGATGPGPVLEGLRLTEREIFRVLETHGVSEIQALGQPFDPTLHKAEAQVEIASQPPGTVLEVVRRGYRLHGRVLRPAHVVIAKAPAPDLEAPA